MTASLCWLGYAFVWVAHGVHRFGIEVYLPVVPRNDVMVD